MSLPDSKLADAQRGVILEKPRANVYTMMLIISFVALVIGSLCLHGEMTAYQYDMKAATAKAGLTAMPAPLAPPVEAAPVDAAAPPVEAAPPGDAAAPAAVAPAE